jgi:hypothetical protein
VLTVAIENLDLPDGKTREKCGRRQQFRRLTSRFPNARFRSRPVSMAAARVHENAGTQLAQGRSGRGTP